MYIRLLIFAALFFVPSYSYANKLTLDSVNSLASHPDAPIRIMVQFKDWSVIPLLKGQLIVNNASNRAAHLSRTLNRSAISGQLGGRFIRPNLRTLSVSRAELAKLLADDSLEVYEDKMHKPSLASSVEVIFPTQSVSPFSGAGQTVAVLDTGVAKNHAFLAGKVIDAAEACFSNNQGAFESLCPNNQSSMIGSGAATPCDSSIAFCAHGTQMAGVIAGQNATSNGVSTSAQIIPVQVFTKIDDEIACSQIGEPGPCVFAYESDIIAGLDYVNSIKNIYSISAVNLSLESTITYQGLCDGNTPADYLSVIADLTSSGIAVVSSSGNGSLANEMASPACIDDVIAVAATNDNDVPNSQNNRSSALDFFAPGVSVRTSSLPTSSFSTRSGTSISAAHVSGAWAVIKSQNPNASVALVKNLLTNTGRLVTQGLFTKPRINLTAALGETVISENDNESSFLPAVYLLLLDD